MNAILFRSLNLQTLFQVNNNGKIPKQTFNISYE